jgi:CheY-like chemotaxis protein
MLPAEVPPAPSSEPLAPAILVVEDEVITRLVISDYLRDCGYKVFEAGSVDEAKSVLLAGTPVELVFSDVQMPGKEDGFALARWIRQHHPGVRVLLTSGISGAAERARDLCEGGPLLAKPYEPATAVQRIQSLLARASRAARE